MLLDLWQIWSRKKVDGMLACAEVLSDQYKDLVKCGVWEGAWCTARVVACNTMKLVAIQFFIL